MRHLSPIIFASLLAVTIVSCEKEKQPTPTPSPSPIQNNDDYQPSSAQKPRSIACANGKVFVTCGYPPTLLRIDTAEGRIDRTLTFSSVYDLEGIAVANGKLFIASSWTTDESSTVIYDNRVYVVDIATFKQVHTITVPSDPQRVKALDDTHVVVSCGNGSDVASTSVLIDATTYNTTVLNQPMTTMDVDNGWVYSYSGGYNAPANFFRLNPLTGTIETILTGCGIQYPYSINLIGGNIYVTTSGNYTSAGDVVCFQPNGTQMWQSEAGMLPSKIVAIGDGTAYVLNEGGWGTNDASLDRLNLTTGAINHNVFSSANGRGLGDVAQDVAVYGTKAYITVSFSNTVEVVSLKDNTSHQIAL